MHKYFGYYGTVIVILARKWLIGHVLQHLKIALVRYPGQFTTLFLVIHCTLSLSLDTEAFMYDFCKLLF